MVSVIGLGFVGSALHKSFGIKKVEPLFGYDKFKDGGIGSFEDCLKSKLMFICLPTPYNDKTKAYGKEAIFETMRNLSNANYTGVIVIKSTVEPGTTNELSNKFSNLRIAHNPEFLSAATAFQDFHNQKHIVLGKGNNCEDEHLKIVHDFYQTYYPDAEISTCLSNESESMKSFVNCFYAVKIQFFNELYLLCQANGTDYDTVKELMLKNKWINPMHTAVPGRDGQLSYGGGCFPKDTNALLQHMKRAGTAHSVLEGCIHERNEMRGESSKQIKESSDFKEMKVLNGFHECELNDNKLMRNI